MDEASMLVGESQYRGMEDLLDLLAPVVIQAWNPGPHHTDIVTLHSHGAKRRSGDECAWARARGRARTNVRVKKLAASDDEAQVTSGCPGQHSRSLWALASRQLLLQADMHPLGNDSGCCCRRS